MRSESSEYVRKTTGFFTDSWGINTATLQQGGWSQKGKRRCRRSLSCRTRSEAPKWTWMAEAFRRSRWESTRESGSAQMELTGLKMRKEEEIEVGIAEWFGLEHREEVYEKIQRHA